MPTTTLAKPQTGRRYNPLPDLTFPWRLFGAKEQLPYRTYIDDFDPVECQYLIVTRDIPYHGWHKAQSLKDHYKELFRLGYSDSEEELDD